MSGLTSTGFVVETVDEITTAIETDEKATIDQGIDLSPTESLARLNGIVAGDVGALWNLQKQLYDAIDPETATGQGLDVVCALSNTYRKGANSTAVLVSPSGATATALQNAVLDSDGNVLSAGAVVAQIAGRPDLRFTNAIPVGPGGVNQQLTRPWNPASGESCIFVCMQTGAILCTAGTLTAISPPVSGLTTITNVLDGLIGSDIESDADLRVRRVLELVPPNGGTIDSIRETLLKVRGNGPGFVGVIDAIVLENTTNVTDSRGLPPHSVLCVVYDNNQANVNDIASAILKSRGAGITLYDGGSGLSGTAKYSDGRTVVVPFARASDLTMYINITVAVDSTFDTVGGPAAIQALLATYGNAIAASGVKLVPLDFTSIVLVGRTPFAPITGVRDITVWQWDSHSSPTNTAAIPVGILQRPKFDTSRISVTVVPFT